MFTIRNPQKGFQSKQHVGLFRQRIPDKRTGKPGFEVVCGLYLVCVMSIVHVLINFIMSLVIFYRNASFLNINLLDFKPVLIILLLSQNTKSIY